MFSTLIGWFSWCFYDLRPPPEQLQSDWPPVLLSLLEPYRYTTKNSTVYAILLDWPDKNVLELVGPKTSASTRVSRWSPTLPLNFYFSRDRKLHNLLRPQVTLMDYPSKPLIWAPVSSTGGLLIVLPFKPVSPGNAWCLKLEKVS